MPVGILRGHESLSKLSDPAFVRSWQLVYGQCTWGNVFQSPAFARTWYSLCSQSYEPVLVCETCLQRWRSGAGRGRQMPLVCSSRTDFREKFPEEACSYCCSRP